MRWLTLANRVTAVMVLGQPNFRSNTVFLGPQRTAYTVNRPSGIAVHPVDAGSVLLIAQEDDNRVVIFPITLVP